MKRHFIALSLGLGAMLLATQHAFAQSNRCAERDVIATQLFDKYYERRQSIGLGGNDTVVEVFASKRTGSWTITVTLPTGQTCIAASGSSFETLADVPLTPGNDT